MRKRNEIKKQLNYLISIAQQVDESLSNEWEVEYKKEDIAISEVIPDPLTTYVEREEVEYLRYLIYNKLNYMERAIICMKFGIDCQKNYEYEIAKKLKISRQMLKILQREALLKLKTYLLNDTLIKKVQGELNCY